MPQLSGKMKRFLSKDEGASNVVSSGVATTKNVPAWLRRLPNQLTWFRVFCIPLVVVLLIKGDTVVAGTQFSTGLADKLAALVFTLAGITDFFDGWVARRFGVETVLGKLLDPLADKLLDVSALIILVEKHRLAGWIAVVLIVRDLGINAIRLSALEDNIVIAANPLAKWKTFFLDVGIVGLMIYGPLFEVIPALEIGQVAVWLALAASLGSAFLYLWDYGHKLRTS